MTNINKKILILELSLALISVLLIYLPKVISSENISIIQLVIIFLAMNLIIVKLMEYINRKLIINLREESQKDNSRMDDINIFKHSKNLSNNLYLLKDQLEIQNSIVNKISKDKEILERMSLIKDCILKINREIIKKDNVEEVFDYILERAIKFIDNAHKGSILVFKDGYFTIATSIGFNHNEIKKIKLAPKETYFCDKEFMNKAYIINNISEFNKINMDNNNYKKLKDSNALNIKTTLSCPIVLNDKIYGILNVDSHIQDAFNEDDKFLINYFSEEISKAIYSFKLMEEKLYLARYDRLTGLYNRDYFIEILDEKYDKKNNEDFSFIIIDLDKFKEINDKYGHIIGDEVLKEFSYKLKDIFGENEILARYGGDEFVGILSITDVEIIENKMRKLKELLRKPMLIEDEEIAMKFSYGISSYSDENKDIKKLFKKADQNMYRDKNRNK